MKNPGTRVDFLRAGRRFAAGWLAVAGGALALAQSAPRLANISARAVAGGGGETLIAGFVVAGDGGKTLLVRGVGPTLASFGVPGALVDPVVTLYAGTALQSANDDWGTSGNAAQIAAVAAGVGAFGLPAGSRDAVLLPQLAAGGYSVHATGKGEAGVALVEVYDATPGTGARLANFSARAQVGTGAAILVAGFAVRGDAPAHLLIRGLGPALKDFGLPTALVDPQLAVFREGATTPFLQNNDWGGAARLKAAFAATGALALADASRDAALLATLDPGVYTVQLSGVDSATGVGLIELYDATAAAAQLPAIEAQPGGLVLTAGAQGSLTVIARSLAPLTYQWQKDGAPIAGATADTLLLAPASAAVAGTYAVTVAGVGGMVTSAPARVAVNVPPAALPPAATFDLVGFATKGAGTTGGGVLAPGDANYRVLDASIANKAQQLRTWLESTTALVVDIQVDVDLGALNNLGNKPKTNPELVASGLGTINVRANKTVFSSTGATLRHGAFNLSGQSNIILRNLRFRGLWEFDEESQNPPNSAPWGYKIQDWDYLTIQNGARNIWIDHCDFEKSYDGLADTKAAADLVTFSWCRFGGDTEGAVARQVAYLEKLYQGVITDSRITTTFYRGLREGAYAAQGIPRQSVADIIAHELPHDKCNLVGSSDTATGDIGCLNLTFHHVYYHDCRQRLPRMRFGNAHVFNLYADNTGIVSGTNQATATTCDAAVWVENSLYREVADPFPVQSGTSPAGRLTQTGSRWIRQGVEQSLAGNAFLQDPTRWTWNTGTRNFAWAAAPAPNAAALPYAYRADAVDFTPGNLSWVGVIVPATAADQATLAGWLVRTTH